MRTLLVGCLTLVLFSLFLPDTMAATPKSGGHLVVCQPAEPPGLDPTANTAAAIDRVVYGNVYQGLLKVDPDGKLAACLASGWSISKDGLVYRFDLRRGVTFHDGHKFTAQVVRWNLERAAAKDTVNPHPEYFRGITKIEIIDDHTLTIRLEKPDALFLPHLAEGDAVMLCPDAASMAKTTPIGTGPFRFVRWRRGDRVELERFGNYWQQPLPYLDRLTFKFIPDPNVQVAALKAGDIDVIGYLAAPEMAQQLAADPRFKVFNGTTTGEVILSTNNRAKPFDNLLVRRAMAYAIDRRAVIDLAMFGYGSPIGSHWSPATPYYIDLTSKYNYDPAKAKQLLAKAGYPNGFEASLKLPAVYSYSRRAGEVVADMLRRVNIRLKIELVEWGQWIDRIFKKKEYQLTLIGHVEPWDIGIYANPDYYFQYDSAAFRKAYAKALAAPSAAEAARWFGRCQEIIADDAVCGYLFSAPSLPAMKSEVMGWWHNYPTIALDCSRVWLDKQKK